VSLGARAHVDLARFGRRRSFAQSGAFLIIEDVETFFAIARAARYFSVKMCGRLGFVAPHGVESFRAS